MTSPLLEDQDPRIKYTAAGGETSFEFPWLVYTDFDGGSSFLKVVRRRDDVPETLEVTTDYTVDGLDTEAGGSITLVDAAEADDIFILYRELPIETFFSFATGGDYFAQDVNKNSNLTLQVMQQLRSQLARSAALDPSEVLDSLQLPSPAALKYIRWNAAADELENAEGTGTDPTVKATENDTTAAYLVDKILQGAGMSITLQGAGSFEGFVLSTNGTFKVSSNDTTQGYLNGKLVAGAGISLTENNNGADETLTVAAIKGFPDNSTSTAVSVAGQSANTTFTVGPTGSGADVIMAALDSVPITATRLHLVGVVGGNGNGVGAGCSMAMYAGANADSDIVDTKNILVSSSQYINGTATPVSAKGSNYVQITSTRIFKAYRLSTNLVSLVATIDLCSYD